MEDCRGVRRWIKKEGKNMETQTDDIGTVDYSSQTMILTSCCITT